VTVQRTEDIASKVVSWLTWEKVGMRGKNLARRIVREVKTGIVVNKEATAMKKLRGGFMSALLS
jgi:hypothetical protein